MTRTLITGPGCRPAAPRCLIASDRHVLVWGAEKQSDGSIRAALYVYGRGGEAVRILGDDDPASWRPGIYSCVDPGEKQRLDCGCRAGRFCRKHGDDAAVKWWFEALRRDHELAQRETSRIPTERT